MNSSTVETVPALNLPAIAAALPGEWVAKPYPYDHIPTEPRGYLVRADGLTIWVSANTYSNRGKIEFSHHRPNFTKSGEGIGGGYVELWEPNGGGKVATPSIRCSMTKTPEQLAADISRRLLADSERVEKLARDRIAAQEQADSDKLATLRAVSTAAGFSDIPRDRHSNEARFTVDLRGPLDRGKDNLRNGWGDANVSGQTVDFDLRSIPAGKAVELVKWLRANVFAPSI